MTMTDAGADPLAAALARRARDGGPGVLDERLVAAGDGWRIADVVCSCGPRDRAVEERASWASIALVRAGTFRWRGDHGACLLSPGALLLVEPGRPFECDHVHGAGDRCLSFQIAPERLAALAGAAGARAGVFGRHRLPPLRALAGPAARAAAAAAGPGAEAAVHALAEAVLRVLDRARPERGGDDPRIARVVRLLAGDPAAPRSLAALAAQAGLSPWHFLRRFKAVTGVSPHQWLLRARLRDAAHRLAATRAPVTAVALDVGFDDLSNFIRSFRAEFGVSPRAWRRAA